MKTTDIPSALRSVPEFRPYESYEEALAAAGRILKHKEMEICKMVGHIDSDGFSFANFEHAYRDWTFEDGSPVGVKIEGVDE